MTALAKESPPTDRVGAKARDVHAENAAKELVFAVVGHVGSGTSTVAEQLSAAFRNTQNGQWDVHILKASSVIETWAREQSYEIPEGKDLNRVQKLQDYGDLMRQSDHAAVVVRLIDEVRRIRAQQTGKTYEAGIPVAPDGSPRAYIIDSIRHPAEVHLLRRVYGPAFTLLGVVCQEEERIARLVEKYPSAGKENARKFMERDAAAPEKYGQRVSEAFHLSDYFLDNSVRRLYREKVPNPQWKISEQLSRVAKLITHSEIVRPTASETAMHAAFAAKMKSACLSRQVGAALLDRFGDLISVGANEVPRAGGGVYNGADPPSDDGRCAFRSDKYCSNTREQNSIIESLADDFPELEEAKKRLGIDYLSKMRETRLGELLEFSRAVHAEMEAILAAARSGRSTLGCRGCQKFGVPA